MQNSGWEGDETSLVLKFQPKLYLQTNSREQITAKQNRKNKEPLVKTVHHINYLQSFSAVPLGLRTFSKYAEFPQMTMFCL